MCAQIPCECHESLERLTVTESSLIMGNNYENLNIKIFAVVRLFVLKCQNIFHIQRQEFVHRSRE